MRFPDLVNEVRRLAHNQRLLDVEVRHLINILSQASPEWTKALLEAELTTFDANPSDAQLTEILAKLREM